jgi:hypothetical protein
MRRAPRSAVAGLAAVSIVIVTAGLLLERRTTEDLSPRDETAALVQTWWRHNYSASAYVPTCRSTGRHDPTYGAPIWACDIRSPGSGYRKRICVSVKEHVVWRRVHTGR